LHHSIAEYLEVDAKAYLQAIERNISDPRAIPDLKIRGSAKYIEPSKNTQPELKFARYDGLIVEDRAEEL